ncbi:MAG: dockerin type I domain-containing protein, partial [bacterium]|nr:dockerin type I domain-containing protein [bacterium]
TSTALLIVPQGQVPCVVWPGDVNNDGIVNYGDRSGLNRYILQANLNPTWIMGPGRYRPDAATNPLTYLMWEPQPSVPWATPEGCYMDTDGNGTVNGYDYIAIRVNWMRTHGTPKASTGVVETFALEGNYPNPFNPTTTIRYALPERSEVELRVLDMLGREVAVLVRGTVEAGVHTAVFDARGLESGAYTAVVRMTGLET